MVRKTLAGLVSAAILALAPSLAAEEPPFSISTVQDLGVPPAPHRAQKARAVAELVMKYGVRRPATDKHIQYYGCFVRTYGQRFAILFVNEGGFSNPEDSLFIDLYAYFNSSFVDLGLDGNLDTGKYRQRECVQGSQGIITNLAFCSTLQKEYEGALNEIEKLLNERKRCDNTPSP